MRGVQDAIKSRLNRLIDSRIEAHLDTIAQRSAQLVEFHSADPRLMLSARDHTKAPADGVYRGLASEMVARGVIVDEAKIDLRSVEDFLGSFQALSQTYRPLGDVWLEKCLEHYLTCGVLGLTDGGVHLDIAAAGSPWSANLRERGMRSFRLDLAYPGGVRGHDIGADATDTGLPAQFADRLTLHCAYECFAGDADVRFWAEASRILKPGGKIGIVPLYIDTSHFIATSPYADQRGVQIDAGAVRVWRDDGYREPFGRHYSPAGFVERVWNRLADFRSKRVVHFVNLDEVRTAYPGQRVYCYFMLVCEK